MALDVEFTVNIYQDPRGPGYGTAKLIDSREEFSSYEKAIAWSEKQRKKYAARKGVWAELASVDYSEEWGEEGSPELVEQLWPDA